MKLSEAIREGAKRRPQVKYQLFAYIENSPHCRMMGSCALGAAIEVTLNSTDFKYFPVNEIKSVYPEIYSIVTMPNSLIKDELGSVIAFLNNEQCWTREQIADWLEKEHNL